MNILIAMFVTGSIITAPLFFYLGYLAAKSEDDDISSTQKEEGGGN